MENIFRRRRDKVREVLLRRGLDASLIASPANRFYLSGFELHDPQLDESAGYIVVSASGDDWLATDSRYELAAKALWDPERVWIYGGASGVSLNELLARVGSLIGFETRAVSARFAGSLATGRKRGFVPAFASADGIIERFREIKETDEIRALKASFALNHKAVALIEEKIASGEIASMTEKELAWQIERFFRENGAQELAFSTIVARNEHAALPHAVPTDAKIGEDGVLLVDLGCRVENYCSDQTRTWALGSNPPPDFAKTLELVKDAQAAAMEIMRPGVECSRVYARAREVFEKAGVERAFNHGLGHGVGLRTHEAPSLSSRSEGILEEGMVVTVEPGLYFGEWGGVRWENTVLVVADGIEIL
ncbi:MAG: M24 family metallopeptidase [Desulfovibrio sp.]|nr:M24 family metallopeptidase [Desulfovibrio sp.]